MSLRTKLLGLFAALAIIPLLAIGVLDYLRSVRAVEQLIETQTTLIATRAADELSRRYAGLQANLALFAENAEAPRLYGGTTDRADATRFLSDLWANIGRDFIFVSYRDTSGVEVYRLGGDASEMARAYVVADSVRQTASGQPLGSVQVGVRLDSLFPRSALEAHFGRSGRSQLFDRARGGMVLATGGTSDGASSGALAAVRGGPSLGGDGGRLVRFRENDSTRLGALAEVHGAPFVVLSLASLEEFAGPFSRIRSSNMVIVLMTTMLVAVAFVILLWGATRSLSTLTLAADAVGLGNLRPPLPAAGRDEVGRLSDAFGIMLDRVRATMAEIERSRQMAAIGEFASQISHEIRNPLTSIKLNLQRVERGTREGLVPAEFVRPVEISLREIQRLDRVVRGVLRLGRGSSLGSATFVLADAVIAALDGLRPSLDGQGVSVDIDHRSSDVRVTGDRALVEAVFVNLIMNAAEAMPHGGTIRLMIDSMDRDGAVMARVRVEDEGVGVAPEHRDRIFTPFFSTKPEGTGLGLALALRTVEEHRGRMTLDDLVERGAAFVVELPAVVAI